MRSSWRFRGVVPVLCVLVASLLAPTSSEAIGLSSGPLTVPGMQWLDGGQQEHDQFVANRLNPQAVFARESSQTAYAHLGSAGVGALLAHFFPASIAKPAGAASVLPHGARIVGYPSGHALNIELPGHLHGIVESTVPLAKHTAGGRFTPIDLSIVRSGAGFSAANSDLAVHIPRRLSSGVSIPADGVTLTPLLGNGRAAGGVGSIVKSAIVYANTQSATDTVVKPTATGFQLDAILRSASSPQKLRYRVGSPAGSRLVLNHRSSDVLVVRGKTTLATILPPGAVDAAETTVPASMSLAGHTLVVSVAHRAGSYLYPIDVDPEINDSQLAEEPTAKKRSNWKFKSSNEARFGHKAVYEGAGKEHLETTGTAQYTSGEFAYWAYETKGNSKIYELKTKTSAKNKGAKIESYLEFQTGATRENQKVLSTESVEPEYSEKTSTICGWNASKVEECLAGAGKEKNTVRFQQSATTPPGTTYLFSDTMSEAIVSISEPAGEHATTSFNTISPEVEGEVEIEGKKVVQKRTNALYGAGIWLTNTKGALQMIAKDPGIGVSATHLEYEKSAGSWERLSEHNYLEVEHACEGVQCYVEHTEYWTLDPKLPDGEDKIRYRAQEAIAGTESPAEEAGSTKTIKVDTGKPHNISLSGLPYGDELSERPYKLTASAIDGTGSTVPSSGIKKLSLFVSGHEIAEVGTQTGCTVAKGECVATAEWSINGAELGAGHHAIVIVVTDNAGNEARKEETISIRHSTPVALGPGSVDLQSGDFALGTTDVNAGSGLVVSRDYSSRATEAGEQGPLGRQWSLNLGSTESVVELVDHSVMLTDANGQKVVFALLENGEFESPTGDANLKLSLEENKTTKEKLAYYLEDSTKHTKTKFTLPSGGSTVWVPTKQEGTVATDTLSLTYQTAEGANEYSPPESKQEASIVTGADGNLWFGGKTGAENKGGSVGRIPISGTPITEYSTGFPAEVVTKGPDGNVWFTREAGKVGKVTPSGKVTQYEGTVGHMRGIVAGPDGNLWITDSQTNQIGKITTSGTLTRYSVAASSEPWGITAGPDGNLWFAEKKAAKILKMTTAGVVAGEYAITGKPQQITLGPDKNLWFTNGTKVGKITTTGSVTEYTLPAGSEAIQITSGPDGNLWFTEYPDKIAKITTSGTISQYSLPSESKPEGITVGPDGKLWFTEAGSNKIGTITTAGNIVEPTEVLAPVPAGVSCSPEMKAGCRALKFTYASTTTATGEGRSQWGEFKGRLAKVLLNAYNPTSKKMQETAVAEYSYDKLGRLRAEWDPRVSPALKIAYGYDVEGHVTALTPPGQESWGFIYGPIAGDAGTGRLLKLTQASASTTLWGGEALTSSNKPYVTGSGVVGQRLSVNDSEWSVTPFTFGYQWEDCDSAGENCTPIVGANNANYTVTAGDLGHTLAALVTGTNGGGSVTVQSMNHTEVVVVQSAEYSLPAGSTPAQIVNAYGSETNMWFTDPGLNKVDKMTGSGTVSEYTGETGEQGLVYVSGNVWFAAGKGTINKMTPGGTLTKYVDGHTSSGNYGIALGSDGNLWFTEQSANYIGKMNTSGTVLAEYALPAGSEPKGIAAASDGNLWFVNSGTNKVGKITTAGVITEYALPAGSKPVAITDTAEEGKKLWFADQGTSKIGKIDPTSGAVTEYSLPAGSEPAGVAPGSGENVWFTDTGTNKIGHIGTKTGTIKEYSLPSSSHPIGIHAGLNESMWLAYSGTGKIGTFDYHDTEGELRSPQLGYTMEYGVPLSGSGLPSMTSGEVATWGQTDVPIEATAVLPADAKQGWPATSYTRATVYYLDERGRQVNVSTPTNSGSGSVSTREYNEANDVVRTLSIDNRVTALQAGSKSVEVAKSLSTYYSYRAECSKESENKHETESLQEGTRLCDVEGPQHTIKYVTGKEQHEALARLHTKYFYDEEAPSGETYNLQTKSTTLAQLSNEEEVEVHKTVTSYSGQSNLGWKLRAPTSVTVDPEGKKLTTTTLYNSTTGQVTETRAPAGSGGSSPHDTKFIYYTAAANTEGYAACGEHPEWAGLLCESLPAKQPETSGVPNLPVITTTYNMYNEPLVITETFGSTVRTKTKTYDEAGRLLTSETTSTANTALPKLTNEYNSSTGVLEKLSTTVEGKTQTITSKYNTWGQLTEYTDADGNVAKYHYGGLENDGLLEEMTDGSDSGTGKQQYYYDSTTKMLNELVDSAAGTFTARYDAEGRMVTEVYPDKLCGFTTYNEVGEAVKLEYGKTFLCVTHSGTWLNESRVPSVRGQTFSQTGTLANETYFYDSVGRLTETQETPAGEGCSERLYAYDEESNRTSQTTRVPGAEGKCATEGGTTLEHTYDGGNRLTDTGVSYDSFGDITKLPAGDAEGHELTTSYYVDGAVASQTQNGVTNSYLLDPEGRIRETGTGLNSTVSHYDGSGQAVAWTSETEGKSTRNIPGIDGSLAATQTNGETPILQLHDLRGDITATAALSTSETKLLSTYNSTEFGVPNKEAPPKFAWLGAGGVSSALSSGVITYGATSYVPQIGGTLQSEPVEAPGIAPGGTGAGAQFVSEVDPTIFQGAASAAAEAPGREAAREQAAAEAAAAAAEAAEEEGGPHDPQLRLYLTAGQAKILAALLEKSVAELRELARSGTIKGFTARWVNLIAQLWGERGFGYNWGMAKGLWECAKAINSTSGSPARCKFKLDYFDYRTDESHGNGTPEAGEVTAGYEVFLCWGKKNNSGGKVWWSFPYCSLEKGLLPSGPI